MSTGLALQNTGPADDIPTNLSPDTFEFVEIAAGIAEGELVVVGNRGSLKPGKRVMPKLIKLAEVSGAH